eukprot:UN06780
MFYPWQVYPKKRRISKSSVSLLARFISGSRCFIIAGIFPIPNSKRLDWAMLSRAL